ncbi:MAG: M14 family metallopeptidase [Acetatifactor sp.]
MKKELLYTIPSLYRDDFRIHGYRFGQGRRALCVVGSMRGNEYQQIYTCSRLVSVLKRLEDEGALEREAEILVIPALNPSSMNIEKRFWPTDNTDINRMFPGYRLGETTQRIAAGIFEEVSTYENGIQLASFYMPGKFSPHVRMMKTGYENVEKARAFGLPYIVLKVPKPYDTTTLNYNWQIWETNAFSLYGTVTDTIDEESAEELVQSILRFIKSLGMLKTEVTSGVNSRVLTDRELLTLRPEKSGIFRSLAEVNSRVEKGQLLAYILDACEGEVVEEIRASASGILFFAHNKPLVYANTAVFKMLPI